MGKRGRPRKHAERTKAGRGKPAYDHGNDRVVAVLAAFRRFQDGKADQWVLTSAIGRAWAVGLLDGFEADAAAIRDAGLAYAARYWGYYPTTPGISSYGDGTRGGKGWGDGRDPRGEAFRRMDAAVDDAGACARLAAHELVVDHYWFPQENPAWLDRLINARLVRAGADSFALTPQGSLPIAGDRERLVAAVTGLLALVAGVARRNAA